MSSKRRKEKEPKKGSAAASPSSTSAAAHISPSPKSTSAAAHRSPSPKSSSAAAHRSHSPKSSSAAAHRSHSPKSSSAAAHRSHSPKSSSAAAKSEAELNAELFELMEEEERRDAARIATAIASIDKTTGNIKNWTAASAAASAIVVPPMKPKHIDKDIFGIIFKETDRLTKNQKCNVINEFLLELKGAVFAHKTEKHTLQTGTLNMIDRYLRGDAKIRPCSSHEDKYFGTYLDYLMEFLFTKVFFNDDTIGRQGEPALNAFYYKLWNGVRSSRIGLAKYGPTSTKGGSRSKKRMNRRLNRTRKI
jgi:hypothetical protein